MIEIDFGALHVAGRRTRISASDVSTEKLSIENDCPIIVTDRILPAAERLESISPIEIQPRLIGRNLKRAIVVGNCPVEITLGLVDIR